MFLFCLPGVTLFVFVFSLFFIKNKNTTLLFVCSTGLLFSFVETFIFYRQYGFDNLLVLNNLFYFVLVIVLNSLNCVLKMLFFSKNRHISFCDFLSFIGLFVFVLKFIAK